MGYATTRSAERVAASVGVLGSAPIRFETVCDVPKGGVLLALPSLLAVGLLRYTTALYQLPQGFYGIASIFLLLAMQALARIKSIEQLRYVAPGEWGNLLGLDRIPEVRTLRQKLEILCREAGRALRWNTELAKAWIAGQRESELVFYVDGHVRVYHGDLPPLPHHYVARERLCLRATTDYWINAMDGQPFVFVNKEVDPGLLATLRNDLAPWLETNAPASAELQQRMRDNPRQHRFTLVFDREAYSPEFFAEMKARRIAILSYRKYPGEDWPVEEFVDTSVRLASGEEVTMRLAERGTMLSNRLWVREVRKLSEGGHQTSILSTNYQADYTLLAVSMFARWSQENFYKYMRQHYGLDRLAEHGTEPVPDPIRTVNPAWRRLDAPVPPRAKKGGGNWRYSVLWICPDWRTKRWRITNGKRRACKKPLRTWIVRWSNSKRSAKRRRITSPSRICRNRNASAACSPSGSISSTPSNSSPTGPKPVWHRCSAISSAGPTMRALCCARSTTRRSI
jgi:hypothetical protein